MGAVIWERLKWLDCWVTDKWTGRPWMYYSAVLGKKQLKYGGKIPWRVHWGQAFISRLLDLVDRGHCVNAINAPLPKRSFEMNHNHFVIALCLFVIATVWFFFSGSTDGLQIMDVIILDLSRASLLLGIFFALLHFLKGTKYDVLEEVFGQNNSAASILLTGLLIAMAVAFG